MKTATLEKYINRRGALRFQKYYVRVEVLDEEDREEGFASTKREFGDEFPGGYRDVFYKGTRTVKYCLIKEKGKKKWVEAYKLNPDKKV